MTTHILARSKVGIHLNRRGDADATTMLLQAEPALGLGVNIGPPGEVYDYGANAWRRQMVWIGRVYEDEFQIKGGNYPADPVEAARVYAARWLAPFVKANPWCRFLTTPNEPVIPSDDPAAADKMLWFALFLAELIRVIHVELQCTAVAGNWSVGAPDFWLWQYYTPALAAIARYGAINSRHSYGPLTVFYALRHREDNRHFTALGYPDLTTALTEAGWENLSEGGQVINRAWATDPRRPASEYADYLVQLNDHLLQDRYVLGAVVFTHGEPWPQHALNGSGVGAQFGARMSTRPQFRFTLPAARPALTNQSVFNAVAAVGKQANRNLIAQMPYDLVGAMAGDRGAPYTGPAPAAWGLTEDEKRAVAERIGLDGE